MSFYRGICINQDGIEWYEPSDSPFLKSFLNVGVTVTMEKHVMFRLIDSADIKLKGFSFEVDDEDNGIQKLGDGPSYGRLTTEQATHLVSGAIPITDARFAFLGLNSEQTKQVAESMPTKPIYHSILY